jgi:hypothetical protein
VKGGRGTDGPSDLENSGLESNFDQAQCPSGISSRNSLLQTEVKQHAGHVIVLGSRADEQIEIAHHSPQ